MESLRVVVPAIPVRLRVLFTTRFARPMTSTNGRTPDALLGSPAVGARDGALRADGHLVNRIPVAVAVVVAALGCVVLSGWVFGVSVLKSGVPGLVEMKANTRDQAVRPGRTPELTTGRVGPGAWR